MEYRPLEITVISAKDLNDDVNLFSKTDVYYAVVTLFGDHRTKQKTPIDRDGGKRPNWNFTMKFTVDENLVNQNRLILAFQLKAEMSLGDKHIGEVHVPVKELLDSDCGGEPQFVSYQVRNTSGKPMGVLNVSYKFGDKVKVEVAEGQVTACPPYPPPGMAGTGAGLPYPPQGVYTPLAGHPSNSEGYMPVGYPTPGGHAQPVMAGYQLITCDAQPVMKGYGQPPMAGYGTYPPQGGPGYGGYPPQGGAYVGHPQQKQLMVLLFMMSALLVPVVVVILVLYF